MSPPFILGLTGGIGMGKSTVSQMFQDEGVPVLDSDRVVHDLYAPGGAAVSLVEAAFPGVVIEGAISRPLLSQRVVSQPEALAQLESIVHPLVQQSRAKFLAEASLQNIPLVVLDIPLLFETGANAECDAVAVVSAPTAVQRARVLARQGMTQEKLEGIIARQLPDGEKRQRADFVIHTGVPLQETREHVRALIKALRGRQGKIAASSVL